MASAAAARCRQPRCVPRAPGPPALIAFDGFAAAAAPPALVLLQGRGDPDAVARWLAAALAAAAGPAELPRHCLAIAMAPWRPLPVQERSDAAFTYRIRLARGGGLTLACWRRHGEHWLRRCGPMPLQRFLRHRLDRPQTLL